MPCKIILGQGERFSLRKGRDLSMKTWIQVCAQFFQGSMSESNVNISGLGGVGSEDGKIDFFFFASQWINRQPCLSRVHTLNYYIIKAPNQRFRCFDILSPLKWCRRKGKNTICIISIFHCIAQSLEGFLLQVCWVGWLGIGCSLGQWERPALILI